MSADKWIWMGHAGHFILGHKCRFHLNTYVNGYIVSTVGDYVPDSTVIDIVRPEFKHLRGDEKEYAYMKKYNCESIGSGEDDKYETMVFKAGKELSGCCPYRIIVEEDFECKRYKNSSDATKGHYALCKKYDKKEVK